MSNSRINKFIFKDAGFFLRLKTEAKNLKVRKSDQGYIMEIPTHSDKGSLTEIPILYFQNVRNLQEVQIDALGLGCNSENLEKATNQKEFFWGQIVKIKNFETNMHYYYVLAKGEPGSVRIGPLHKGIDGSKIEMDFENLQWESAK